MTRQAVLKTYKLFIGGQFPRSESGYSAPVTDKAGNLLAHICKASRKDARMAVTAARKALPGWRGAKALLRSQIIYRMAEMLETRALAFAEELASYGNLNQTQAKEDVARAVDRLVWYAGWADKFGHVLGSHNPVGGPFFNFSVPEPMGVVAAESPADGGLLSLVSVLAPIIVSGNTLVLVQPAGRALSALSFAEVLATSDLPGGVVNILSGEAPALMPILAGHMDVNGLWLDQPNQSCEAMAADSVKRVHHPPKGVDWRSAEGQSPFLIGNFVEIKTVWHPIGS